MSNDDGQTGFAGLNPTSRTLSYPYGVYLSGKQLFVSDFDNNRVLIFNGK
ncbi:hypothetical protein [Leptospira meyeri]|nr:hypothetical protein [Leptospira meyeri]